MQSSPCVCECACVLMYARLLCVLGNCWKFIYTLLIGIQVVAIKGSHLLSCYQATYLAS